MQPTDVFAGLAVAVRAALPTALDRTAGLLAGEASLLAASGRPRGLSGLGSNEGRPYQSNEAFLGQLPVVRLMAAFCCGQGEDAALEPSMAGQDPQPFAGILGKTLDGVDRDPQLDAGRDLVDVLAPRTAGTRGPDHQGLRGDPDARRDLEMLRHGVPCTVPLADGRVEVREWLSAPALILSLI